MSAFTSVDVYIQAQESLKKEVLSTLQSIIKAVVPDAQKSIKWAQAVYEDEKGPFCFMRAHKNRVTIGFWRGAIMNDSTGLLTGEREKM